MNPRSLCSLLRIVLSDLACARPRAVDGDLEAHAHAAVDWLLRAQAAAGDGGISAYFDLLRGGWTASYPETTGYIIPVLLAYARSYGREDVRVAALRMGEYELAVQLPDGAFPALRLRRGAPPRGVAFDTSQVLFGLLAAQADTGDDRYAAAAVRAGDWLVATQRADGAWADYHGQDTALAINTRVAWPLLQLAVSTGDLRYRAAACRQLDWTLTRQTPNGWFASASFVRNQAPVVHTIAYVVEGLLESGLLLSEERYVTAATQAAGALLTRLSPQGRLAGAYDRSWQPAASWSCLTGDAQIARVWLRLGQLTGQSAYRTAAERTIRFVAATQRMASSAAGVRGGVAGSWPIYGRYLRLKYPNWATCFLLDAILMSKSSGHHV